MLVLEPIKQTDPRILANMAIHYSQPKGFVGRNICYAVLFNNVYYGSIVGGSATLHLPGRNEYLGINPKEDKTILNKVINNIFFHIEKVGGEYPIRNFATKVIKEWRKTIVGDWRQKYNDNVIGFETLIEKPRTGECYKRDGWVLIGETKGYTCKRTAESDIVGKSTDNWSGKRIWNTNKEELRPKLVFAKKID